MTSIRPGGSAPPPVPTSVLALPKTRCVLKKVGCAAAPLEVEILAKRPTRTERPLADHKVHRKVPVDGEAHNGNGEDQERSWHGRGADSREPGRRDGARPRLRRRRRL